MRTTSRSRTAVVAKPDLETRERLLATAAHLFAERGFKEVTVRDICRHARANVAAVNYHFGGKLGLYRHVVRSAIDLMQSTTAAVRAAADGRPAVERLRVYVDLSLRRAMAVGGDPWVRRLLNWDVSDPTPALAEFVERGVRPRVDYLGSVVADLLGCPPDDPQVLRAVTSIQAQLLFYLPNPIAARLGVEPAPTPDRVDELARHIVTFSLGGIRAIADGHAPPPPPVAPARDAAERP